MFSYIKTFILSFMVIIVSSPLYASPDPEELTHFLSVIHTMQADFVQKVFDNRGKMIQQSTGKMAIAVPGKFRWEIKQPIPQLIIANGARLFIYDPDLEQLTIKSLDKGKGNAPALFLSQHGENVDKEYHVQKIQKKASLLTWFRLLPKQSESLFEQIQLGFKNNEISEMQLTDHLGHTTHIQFNHIKLNSNLAASLFIFKPKVEVDIIDETQKRG